MLAFRWKRALCHSGMEIAKKVLGVDNLQNRCLRANASTGLGTRPLRGIRLGSTPQKRFAELFIVPE